MKHILHELSIIDLGSSLLYFTDKPMSFNPTAFPVQLGLNSILVKLPDYTPPIIGPFTEELTFVRANVITLLTHSTHHWLIQLALKSHISMYFVVCPKDGKVLGEKVIAMIYCNRGA